MRIAAIGALAVFGLAVVFALSGPSVGYGQWATASPAQGGSNLVTIATPAGEGRQQLTIVDPQTRGLAVYHIDTASGEVSLKSVRNIQYDLRMIEFNGTSPLPGEIRSILEPTR
jgi:hypothetical protein